MQMVDVCDEEGGFLAKVKVGDTKTKALGRLGKTEGALLDKDGMGLADDENIVGDGGPYTFKTITTGGIAQTHL